MSEYAVVLFSYDECPGEGATPGMRCVMEVHGPFPTKTEADSFADTVPGFVPHIMALQPPVTKGSHPYGSIVTNAGQEYLERKMREVPCPRTDPHEPHTAHGTPGNPGSRLGPDVHCPGVRKNS